LRIKRFSPTPILGPRKGFETTSRKSISKKGTYNPDDRISQ
jgi:hypothetical protein